MREDLFSTLKDRHIATLHRLGRDSGARPFLRHPRVMIALRNEMERRGLMVVPQAEQHYRNLHYSKVLAKMSV